ncbi:family 43 glycosylhydrolase, partial [Streptomyces viridochromogenes]|uniref:family 43 glycosylhydrolase n=1 Tax=Streptomyces viridochromogenes TaxID=1938 RepID=UPI00058722C6
MTPLRARPADPDRRPERRRSGSPGVAVSALAAVPAVPAVAQASELARSPKQAAPYVNPLVRNRADPHVNRHKDGFYYFTATAPEYDRIILRRSRTLNGLGTAAESVIWRAHATGPMGAHIWAPELHRIGGKWYIYFASAPAEDVWAIRIWVLENAHPDPFKGTWVERGQVKTAWETFSLDA